VPASREDLAALDRLLNPRSIPEPVAAPERSGGDWEPRFSPALTGGGRRQPGGRDSKALVLWAILGLLVLAVALGGAYFVFVVQPAERQADTRRPVSTPTQATAQPTTTVAAATPDIAPTAAAASRTPAATRTSAPTKTPAATKAPTTAPTAPPSSGAAGLGEARSLLRSGQFPTAAHAFAAQFRRAGTAFTVQLMVACSDETVKKAVNSVGQDELYIVPVDHKGRSCYKIGWGLYDSESRAASALKALPDYFRQPGVTPRVVTTATVLR